MVFLFPPSFSESFFFLFVSKQCLYFWRSGKTIWALFLWKMKTFWLTIYLLAKALFWFHLNKLPKFICSFLKITHFFHISIFIGIRFLIALFYRFPHLHWIFLTSFYSNFLFVGFDFFFPPFFSFAQGLSISISCFKKSTLGFTHPL